MSAVLTLEDAERRMPPAASASVAILRAKGHAVEVRLNRNGSHRYRVDGSRELTALQMFNRFRGEGI